VGPFSGSVGAVCAPPVGYKPQGRALVPVTNSFLAYFTVQTGYSRQNADFVSHIFSETAIKYTRIILFTITFHELSCFHDFPGLENGLRNMWSPW